MRLPWQRLVAALLAPASLVLEPELPELRDATLDELRAGLDAGRFTSVDLVAAYSARVREVHEQLHAVTELNPDAMAQAEAADRQRAAARIRGTAQASASSSSTPLGPLHGIPVLLKDNIATRDATNTTAGSYALLGATVPHDSTVAARLRKAGAVLLGKANLSQWASFRSLNSSDGWSAYGGQTVGAYFPGHDPSGSSSGSAVAVSVGLAWAALGTETSGSIIHPAHVNNVVGLKPTVGLTSRHLVIPISERQDTVGPLARTVKDAAYLLAAVAGRDPRDNYTDSIPFDPLPDYVGACSRSGLEGKRLGVPRNLLRSGGHVDAAASHVAFEAALDVLRSAGAEIVEDVVFHDGDYVGRHATEVMGPDFYTNLAQYLAQLETNPNGITSLEQLRAFTVDHPEEAFPRVNVKMWDQILERGYGNDDARFWTTYQAALYHAGHRGLTGALKNHSLDAIVLPTPHAVYEAAVVGAPVISVPLGRAGPDTPVRRNGAGTLNTTAPNQPFGIAFAGARWSDAALISMAYAFEQRTKVRELVRPLVEPETDLRDVVARQEARKEL